MKAKELIEELQKIDPEEEVIVKALDGGLNSVVELRPVRVSMLSSGSSTTYCQYDYEYSLPGNFSYHAIELIGRAKRLA